MLGVIEKMKAKETGPSPEDWARYRVLLEKSKRSPKEDAELEKLLGELKITPTRAQLHAVVLPESERLETLARQNAKAEAADASAQAAEGKARADIIDQIFRLQRQLQNNDFPEARAALVARRYFSEEVMPASSQAGALRSSFPELFGRPRGDKQAVFSEADFPVTIQNKMRELKIRFSDL